MKTLLDRLLIIFNFATQKKWTIYIKRLLISRFM